MGEIGLASLTGLVAPGMGHGDRTVGCRRQYTNTVSAALCQCLVLYMQFDRDRFDSPE